MATNHVPLPASGRHDPRQSVPYTFSDRVPDTRRRGRDCFGGGGRPPAWVRAAEVRASNSERMQSSDDAAADARARRPT